MAKIQANQQANYDSQAAKDELNALRVRDQVEIIHTNPVLFTYLRYAAGKLSTSATNYQT